MTVTVTICFVISWGRKIVSTKVSSVREKYSGLLLVRYVLAFFKSTTLLLSFVTVKEKVAKYFNISKDDLTSDKRSNNIAYPRQIAMYLCREIANLSFPKIGEDFGKRDHSTVMHAYKKIESEVKDGSNTKLIVESVKNIIIGEEN